VLLWHSVGLVAENVRIDKIRMAADLASLIIKTSMRKGIPYSHGTESNLIQYGVRKSTLFWASSNAWATAVSWMARGSRVRASRGGFVKPHRITQVCDAIQSGDAHVLSKPAGLTFFTEYETFFAKSASMFCESDEFYAWEEFRNVIRDTRPGYLGISPAKLAGLLESVAVKERRFDVAFDDHVGIGSKGSCEIRGGAIHEPSMPFWVDGPMLLEIIKTLQPYRMRQLVEIPVLVMERGPHCVYMRGRPIVDRQERKYFSISRVSKVNLPIRNGRTPPCSVALTDSKMAIQGPKASIVWLGKTPNQVFLEGLAANAWLQAVKSGSGGISVAQSSEVPHVPPVKGTPLLKSEILVSRLLSLLMYFAHLNLPIHFNFEDGHLVVSASNSSIRARCRIGEAVEFEGFKIGTQSIRWMYGMLRSGGKSRLERGSDCLVIRANGAQAVLNTEAARVYAPPMPSSSLDAQFDIVEARKSIKKVMRKARTASRGASEIHLSLFRDRLNNLASLKIASPTPNRNYARVPISIIRGRKMKVVALLEDAVTLVLGSIQGSRRRKAEIRVCDGSVIIVRRLHDWEATVEIKSI